MKTNKNLFLTITDEIIYNSFRKIFIESTKTKNQNALEFIKKTDKIDLIENTSKIVQFGWKREAVPITNEKKSIITKIFNLFFK